MFVSHEFKIFIFKSFILHNPVRTVTYSKFMLYTATPLRVHLISRISVFEVTPSNPSISNVVYFFCILHEARLTIMHHGTLHFLYTVNWILAHWWSETICRQTSVKPGIFSFDLSVINCQCISLICIHLFNCEFKCSCMSQIQCLTGTICLIAVFLMMLPVRRPQYTVCSLCPVLSKWMFAYWEQSSRRTLRKCLRVHVLHDAIFQSQQNSLWFCGSLIESLNKYLRSACDLTRLTTLRMLKAVFYDLLSCLEPF